RRQTWSRAWPRAGFRLAHGARRRRGAAEKSWKSSGRRADERAEQQPRPAGQSERVDAINDAFGPVLGQVGFEIFLLGKGAESFEIRLIDVETGALEALDQLGLAGQMLFLAEVDGDLCGGIELCLLLGRHGIPGGLADDEQIEADEMGG